MLSSTLNKVSGNKVPTRRQVQLIVSLAMLATVAVSLRAQDGTNPIEVSKWPTEKIILRDGQSYEGHIRHETDEEIELVQIGRRPGQPLSLLVRWIAVDKIAEIHRLPPEQRSILKGNIDRHKNRTRIAARLREQVKLQERQTGKQLEFIYDGPWFSFVSTTEESLTRDAIVRLEQMFAGYRTFIPPRKKPDQLLRIVLLNTLDEYLEYQRRANINIRNWAYFDAKNNEIVAGGQLARFTSQLRVAEQYHQKLLKQQQELKERERNKLSQKKRELQEAGASNEEIRLLLRAAHKQESLRLDAQKEEIRQAKESNGKLYQQQFRLLYHEAFHAYLDNYVYDKTLQNVPRWLHEGWAQVFENGLLDAGTLRLDAADTVALVALQTDLLGGSMLPLENVIAASSQQYLVQHDNAARSSNRIYLYSWGLAHYLTFQMQLLESDRLNKFVDASSGAADPVTRFEVMVGMSVDQFQQQWREKMLELTDG
ncbi:MAG: DUF1570 domain-containing protein [Planctomycetales bacterium]